MACSADMQHVMIVPSAACVNFPGLGKLLALNKRCFVAKLLFVVLLRSFQCNFMGKVIVYWELWGKICENRCNFGESGVSKRQQGCDAFKTISFQLLLHSLRAFCCKFG